MFIALCGVLAAVAGCTTPNPPPAATPSGVASTSATAVPTSLPRHRSTDSAPASATLIAFVQVRSDSGDAAGEVTRPEQLEPFLVGPPAADQQVRDAVQRYRRAGVRLFAFVLNGCQNDGASLVIQPARIYAILTGGVGVECFVAEQYLAVFAVPTALVADRARIG